MSWRAPARPIAMGLVGFLPVGESCYNHKRLQHPGQARLKPA